MQKCVELIQFKGKNNTKELILKFPMSEADAIFLGLTRKSLDSTRRNIFIAINRIDKFGNNVGMVFAKIWDFFPDPIEGRLICRIKL